MNYGTHPGLPALPIASQYVSENDFYLKRGLNRFLVTEALSGETEETRNIKSLLLSDLDNKRCLYSRRLSLESLYSLNFSERLEWIKTHLKDLMSILEYSSSQEGYKKQQLSSNFQQRKQKRSKKSKFQNSKFPKK